MALEMPAESRDSFSMTIVDDLLSGHGEWKDTNDIIRLTFKALSEVVKNQGNTLREIDRQLAAKVTAMEMTSGLNSKADEIIGLFELYGGKENIHSTGVK
jgi:flagellar motor switch protein FliM